ncbi:hypothetical protein JKF63_07363 [Porcisia hertigi]|uniref:Uncharacterized protein n=1 Tax=Porcisia hertigi TaxID=2761500 RepID=A0A836LKS3_9TRYP|nr:hypothetical protein JKF63_07363 [Porcisia hertigi]
MLTDRTPCGDIFNNPYTESTLIGNWLEDRLQERIVHTGRGRIGATWCATGFLEDPAVTKARHPEKVQASLLHSTYDVDYGNCLGVSQLTGIGDGNRSGVGTTLMLGYNQTANAMGPAHASSRDKRGVDRVLLFSVDPVADPAAPMPVSSYTDTYGRFYHRDTDGSDNGGKKGRRYAGSTMGATTLSSAEKVVGEVAAPIGTADRNLYDSVLRATAAAPLPSCVANTAYMGNKTNPGAASLPPVPQRHMITRGLPATNTLGNTGWTLASSSTPLPVCSISRAFTAGARQKHSRYQRDSIDRERWCSSKQAADTPVEHFTLQRRLPPAGGYGGGMTTL